MKKVGKKSKANVTTPGKNAARISSLQTVW
jgi:hypothetical protein